MKFTLDVNVPTVANGGEDVTASAACQALAIDLLQKIVERHILAIDDNEEILNAYKRHLHPEGQPGVGDRFLRHILDNQGNDNRVSQHDLHHPRTSRLRAAFAAKGTLKDFDADDRMYALCGVAARAQVHVAVDSDWLDHEAGLAACGVRLNFVCGRDAAQRPSKKTKVKKALRKAIKRSR